MLVVRVRGSVLKTILQRILTNLQLQRSGGFPVAQSDSSYIQETRLWANCGSQQLIGPIGECSLLLDLCCLKVRAHRNGRGSSFRSGGHFQSGICVSRRRRHKHVRSNGTSH